jgi:bifunctional DNA-binding transcriptional regulator/antitoxin component of YhaV-PrlF toxin-antitoxin module
LRAMTEFEQEFEAALEADPHTGDVFVVPPFSVEELYGTKEELPVQAAIDGFPYQGELVPLGEGYHALVIPREVRRAVGKTVGDVLRVALRHDTSERVVSLPEDLAAGLTANEAATRFFKTLTKLEQRSYVRYLKGAKNADIRAKRLTETLYRLSIGRKRE